MDDELELELLVHEVTANLDPVHTYPGKYRNAYIFLRLALPSTLKRLIPTLKIMLFKNTALGGYI